MRTLITNGLVVTADGSYPADVLVDGETIALVGTDLAAAGVTAEATIDATGKYVVPGGIDAHTHMELPFGGTFAKDTFESGTRAAAHGGTTTIVDFAAQTKGRPLREGLDTWHAKAAGNAVVDYGFHMMMADVNDTTLAEMDRLVAEGVPDFKLFTAYPGVFFSPDDHIFRALQRTRANGGLIMMHAENGPVIDVIAADLVAAGTTDPIGHGLARYAILEAEATTRVIHLAEAAGAPVYFVHLSSRDALAPVTAARDRGAMVFAETCPQYLFLSLDDLGNGFEGAKYVCSPPLRPRDHQEDLWRGLRRNDLQLVGTDHCPFDFTGQKELGRGDFRKIPNGLPAVEDRVDLLHDGGVVGGRISRERWVEIMSTAPAKVFGMYPKKGAIAVGSDADILVYDPNRKRTISAATHHMDVDYSIFEGFEVQGASDVVMSRGTILVRDGAWVGPAGHGTFIPRGPADYVRLA
ncbi:MAG TPA: dihydropyrimidinase [Candidatus Nanopelagicales bacterium]|nr:dihydropyrimidinase [Candidatus Nanopelagicales bacterium]